MVQVLAGTRRHILDLDRSALADWLAERGEPAYRAAQVRRWLFRSRAASAEGMTDLPTSLRKMLDTELVLWTTTMADHHRAADGTEKLALRLADGEIIECVLLRDAHRRTICISSQVGCAMGCVFCASGIDGVRRNLTRGEIVEQMLRLDRLLPQGERISHVVVMGMGEPLANLDNVLAGLDEAAARDGLGISTRRITISTVGIPQAILRLAERNCPYYLAVSLHAPDDALRSQIVPVNKSMGIAGIIEAADAYLEGSGRRLTFEYVLLADVNDQPHHARALARLLSGKTAMVNVIPYNPVRGLPYRTPSAESVKKFVAILHGGGINAQVRQRKGDEIEAACGQLRRMRLGMASAAVPRGPGDKALIGF